MTSFTTQAETLPADDIAAPVTGSTSVFTAFSLAPELLRNLAAAGYVTPTPIQSAAIPTLLDKRDLIGIAQTGTGKTAAFALPMLHRFLTEPTRPRPRNARMIVLSPTRELAVQIADTFRVLSKGLRLQLSQIFGGVSERGQIDNASRGIDILVATPGRLIDLVERRFLTLEGTEVFVLDEADRMLDMGFIRDVRLLMKRLPKARQSMMFSATMPPAIREIAEEMLTDPVKVSVTPKVVTVEKVAQSVYFVGQKQKPRLLLELLNDKAMTSVVVFTRTKHGANRVTQFLEKEGVNAEVIHGNKSQNARQAALNAFKNGSARVLVATDIASRGIDVPGISHVINYELPDEPESYVHRIGRTARAGREGEAIAFCDPNERSQLKAIERLTRVTLKVLTHAAVTSTVHGADNAAAASLSDDAEGDREAPRRSRRPSPRSGPPRNDLREKRFGDRHGRGEAAGGARRPQSDRPKGDRAVSDRAPDRSPAHRDAPRQAQDRAPSRADGQSAGRVWSNDRPRDAARSDGRYDDRSRDNRGNNSAPRDGHRAHGEARAATSAPRTNDNGAARPISAQPQQREARPMTPRPEPRRDERQGQQGLRRQRSW